MKDLLRSIFLKIRIYFLKTDLMLSAIFSVSILFFIFDFHTHLNRYHHSTDFSAFLGKYLLGIIV
jgi:hypothetical protein